MDKDYEFLMEQNKLEDTLKLLDAETLNYIAARKQITEYIIDARKKAIEEYRDDEDKVMEYFDHEAYVKEEAYRTIDKRLREINVLKESPYFGKIDFTEEEVGAEQIYIGRFGVTKDDTYEPIIIDWRAPVASLFYKGTLGDSSYTTPEGEEQAKILSRRQLIIKKAELKGIFDSAVDVKDDILQMVLTSNTSDKLKDIVMTIQAEQDEIIRSPKDKVVVVNGVAGSGKTTIALHRVSYLLYNNRKQFGDKVLIFGPNDIFMDYIAQVLPTLGESGVSQDTFENFAIEEIGLNEPVKRFSQYIEEAMEGNEEALKEYKYKSSVKFTELLDKNLADMEENYFNIQPVNFFDKEIVGIDEIKELFTKYYSYMPLFRRSKKVKLILISKIKDRRDELIRELNKKVKEELAALSETELEIEKNNIEFRRRLRIREIVRGVMNARDELDSWIMHEDTVSLYKRITNTENLGYMDLAGILYLMVKLEGKKCDREIKHVVIDEAQDYNMTQFKLIKELTGCSSYTIVGDTNQRLIQTDEEPAMIHLDKLFGDEVINYKLNKSYRSTQEIMEYANQFLSEDTIVPLVRHGEAVMEEKTESLEETIDTITAIIEDYEEEGLENIAIITKDIDRLREISTELKKTMKVLTFDKEDMIYTGGVVLLPAYYAKGLEFDGVVLLDDLDNTPELVKYIMCTRALHRLAVIK
ncbi:MAG: AAA family ATPase [Clostridiaceae bacterium]|nr:AAA family ATPase [Clostridiaceae bacterium]